MAQLNVCLGFPVFHAPRFMDALREIEGVRPVVLPVDPGKSWLEVSPSRPCDEPPPWATDVAAERLAALREAHVLVALHAPRRLGELAPELRWVQTAGAGIEQFGRVGLGRDVIVTNASGVSAPSMAEWVLGRLLQVWKHFRDSDRYQQEHAFTRNYGRTFRGSTVGIIGLGHIGAAVAERVSALGARVIATRRSARPGDTAPFVDELLPASALPDLLARCDAVVLSAPATPETRHLIDAEALARMPAHATFVNVARGSLVDEVALAEAMRERRIAAAVLDVFEEEPLSPESPLWDLPGVYISAHSSASVDRYADDVFEILLDNVKRYCAGEPLRNRIDPDALGFEQAAPAN